MAAREGLERARGASREARAAHVPSGATEQCPRLGDDCVRVRGVRPAAGTAQHAAGRVGRRQRAPCRARVTVPGLQVVNSQGRVAARTGVPAAPRAAATAVPARPRAGAAATAAARRAGGQRVLPSRFTAPGDRAGGCRPATGRRAAARSANTPTDSNARVADGERHVLPAHPGGPSCSSRRPRRSAPISPP